MCATNDWSALLCATAALIISGCGSESDPSNSFPVASAGNDRVVLVGHVAVLNGSGSYDSDGTLEIFRWTILSSPTGSSVELSDETAATVSITPDLPGEYVLTLVVSDGELTSAPDTITLHAKTNSPPEVESFTVEASDSGYQVGQPVRFRWSVRDPDEFNTDLACALDVHGDNSVLIELTDCETIASYDHTYQVAGSYKPTLTVVDDQTALHSRRMDLTVDGGIAITPWSPSGLGDAPRPVDGEIYVFVTATAVAAIEAVSVNIGGITASLEPAINCTIDPRQVECLSGWEGNIDVSSLPAGEIPVVITATDTNGVHGIEIYFITHDSRPNVNVEVPVASAISSPYTEVRATCSDDTSGLEFTASIYGDDKKVFETVESEERETALDAVLDATPLNEGLGILYVVCMDARGQTTTKEFPVAIVHTDRLTTEDLVDGIILDADESHILYQTYSGRQIVILDRTDEGEIKATLPDDYFSARSSGYLVNDGALILADKKDFSEEAVFHVSSGAVTRVSGTNVSKLVVEGDYAAWFSGIRHYPARYQLSSNAQSAAVIGATGTDLSLTSSGLLSFSSSELEGTYQIYDFSGVEVTRQSDDVSKNYFKPVREDGAILYKERSDDGSYRIILDTTSGSEQIGSRQLFDPNYALNNGWIAYVDGEADRNIWSISPSKDTEQRTFLSEADIEQLASNGEIVLTGPYQDGSTIRDIRYLSRPGEDMIKMIETTDGRAKKIGDDWFVLLGPALIRF